MSTLEHIADVRAYRRKLFISIGRRKQKPGRGSSRELLTKRTASMLWTDLTQVIAPAKCAVVGDVATRLYMPERVTKDIDVVIAVSDTTLAYQKLSGAGFKQQGKLALVRGLTWMAPNGQEIDVLEGEESWWPEAIHAAQDNRDAQGLPILPLPFLALMKYQAGRAQDLADIERMLGQADDVTLDAVRRLFSQHAPAELDDLNSLIELGKLEFPDEDAAEVD
jgi:hypothetical protein